MDNSDIFNISKKILFVVLGNVLPEENVLSYFLENIKKSFLALVITGVLISALILSGCYVFYQYLIYAGIDKLNASLVTLFILSLITIISALFVEKYSKKTKKIKKKISLFSDNEELVEDLQKIAISFLEGVTYKSDEVCKKDFYKSNLQSQENRSAEVKKFTAHNKNK